MRPKILFVDDEPHVTAALQRVLRREPYDIVTAHSADEAFVVMERERVDVVVSDERMPNMLGSEFLSVVRRDYPDTVRIILTGEASLEAAMRAINEGQVYRFLSKPCEEGALTQAIAEGLGQRTSRQEAEVQAKEQEPTDYPASAIRELEAQDPAITEVQPGQAEATSEAIDLDNEAISIDGATSLDDSDADIDAWKCNLKATIFSSFLNEQFRNGHGDNGPRLTMLEAVEKAIQENVE